MKKAEAIRKMLSETTVTAPDGSGMVHFTISLHPGTFCIDIIWLNESFILLSDDNINIEQSDSLKRKVVEEKRQREHILQLNQILAKQVMEKSKMVAGTLNPDFSKCKYPIIRFDSFCMNLIIFSV